MLILPIHVHGSSFHVLIHSSISFFKDQKFLSKKSFTCLARVTSRYFTLPVAILKGTVSMISHKPIYCLHIRGILIFFWLVSYFSISFRHFPTIAVPLQIFDDTHTHTQTYTISYANSNTLFFSFPVCIPLISFSCLIAPARTSIIILNGDRENGQPCLIPDFSDTALHFFPCCLLCSCTCLNSLYTCSLYP